MRSASMVPTDVSISSTGSAAVSSNTPSGAPDASRRITPPSGSGVSAS